MSEIKTKPTDTNPKDIIAAVDNKTRQADGYTLLELFSEVTGMNPKVWGNGIIGYGMYHYKSERSTQEGDWPLTGFSPRKAKMTVYIMPGFKEYQDLLSKLGKHKTSVSCLYINKLADIDLEVLKKLIALSVKDMKKLYPDNKNT